MLKCVAMRQTYLQLSALIGGLIFAACTPIPTIEPTRGITPPALATPHAIIIADAPTATPSATTTPSPSVTPQSADALAPAPSSPTPTITPTIIATPAPSFMQQQIANLYDLARLPVMQNSIATQFTSRNWVSLEHYFDYFIDDGNFDGPNYGYIAEDGSRQPYRIVTGYDGAKEYEMVPLTQGPGMITRIWFAYQQHQSVNNPKDMSQVEEWSNWGNLGAMGNVRFYFDGESTPRLDVNVKDLFDGKVPFPAPLAAFYASADGGNINYVPIPFEKSLRVTSTGRPRLMQIEVKRFTDPPAVASIPNDSTPAKRPNNNVLSFTPYLSPDERATLDQAAQAWQTCTPANLPPYKSFALDIPSNKSAEIDFNQPATIASLRVHVPRGMSDSVWMQVFWDGANDPSMIAPLRGMFGAEERLLLYQALPMGMYDVGLSEHIFYTNLPMPFQSARIVFLNERAETLPLTVDIALRETLPGTENTRLHNQHGTRRMIRREDDSDNYVLVDVNGRGKYLGTIFSAWDLDRGALNGPLDDHWNFPYLESNLDVYVDNRLALPGTGIEDDFNASYYYVYAGYPGYNTRYCLAGLTLLDSSPPKQPSSQYRFYLNDAPEFTNHLRVEVQHGNKGNNLSVTYSSTAFWYQIK